MSLINKTISNYEVLSKIGEGGMGDVYRARDKNLGRDVAIKVLPTAFSADSERLRRFEQEAQAAGSLNHPNILVIYHVGTENGAPYIVSELLEGETLRERINGSPLPQRKVVDYALQIAHGLAAAHEKGIVHRDLKPENIFVTKDGRVKILDFGLAKLTQTDGDGEAQTDIPTRKVKTDPGVVMGTIGYMSPEQVRGRPVDYRSDIFSFGTILYEMLSGKRAFHGESAADVMSAILREDPPDLTQTNKTVAPALERVINHCLEKNPEERFHSARDLAFAIQALSGSTSVSDRTIIAALPAPRRRYRELAAWSLAGTLLLATAAFAVLYFRQPQVDERPARFVVATPDKASEIFAPIVSPDGRLIAFLATIEGKRFLYIRALDSLVPQRLNGTDDAFFPFWSPDSRYIGFFSDSKLKKIEAGGGPPQTLCDAPAPTGGTWSRDGVILFGSGPRKSILRVSAAGGESRPVAAVDDVRREAELAHPSFLPDGRNFLYYAWNGSANDTAIYIASIDNTERKIIMKNDSNVAYANPGYLLFARSSTVMAQPFSLTKLELTGEPFPLFENVTYSPNLGYSHFSASDNGTVVYWSGTSTGRQLAWFDRAGKQLAAVGPPGEYNDVVLSPDDKRAALQRVESGGGGDLWMMDLVRGVPSRFTFGATGEDDPAWSPDGSTIVYTLTGEGKSGLYRKNSSGGGNEELISQVENLGGDGLDWSRDGKYILYPVTGSSGADLWVLPLDGQAQPYALMNSEFSEYQGRFSPDGRWIAYVSNESGRPEIYVRSFPDAGGKWQVSSGGGGQPQWRRDGKELFYVAPDRKLTAVEVRAGSGFEAGTPTVLFQTQVAGYTLPNRYAVGADGQRFLVNSTMEETSQTPITVVLNWTSALKK